jgi:mannose-6-phosphate isomerase-like protein (cupin superfamily)
MDRAAGDTQPLHLPGSGLPPQAVAAGGGEVVWFTTNLMTLKATAESTGGAFGLVEAVGHPGSGPPLHVHHREHEAFWVLEGLLTVRCGEETFTAGPGSFTFLPRGVPHAFVIEGDSPGRILSICTPGGFERYFVAAGRPPEHDGLPPAGPPDVGMLDRVGRDFGLEIVGPPIAPNDALPGQP